MLKFLSSLFRHVNDNHGTDAWIKSVLDGIVRFLLTMMPERSARKIIAIIMLLFGCPVKTVVELSGFKKSSIYKLRRELWQRAPGSDFLNSRNNVW